MEINLQIAAACILVIILVYLLYRRYYSDESFANLEEKASQLSQWVNKNPQGRYVEFIQANPESNIVEYTKLRDLSARAGKTTTKTAAALLRL